MVSQPRGLVPATPAMAEALAGKLSPEHRREVRDLSGMDAGAALLLSLDHSLEAYAYIPGHEADVRFMMGVERPSPITGGALLWMLGSSEAARRPAALLRAALWGLERAFAVSGARRLEQFIPDWYQTGLRFVRRLGFGIMPAPLRRRNGGPLWHVVKYRRTFSEESPWEQSRTS